MRKWKWSTQKQKHFTLPVLLLLSVMTHFVLWPSAVRTGLLPQASPCDGRAPGDCGGWDRPRHHQFLPLRKHRREHREEGNSLGIFPTSSGTHRNIPRSSRSDSGKNICRNVISWNTVKSSTNRGKCHLTVWNIPRWHDKPWDFSCKVWLKS